ncbi:calmodulin-binding transcription activator 1-like [Trichosurus vulpecula]|uniref:calmodulin-binding transcription activator 1-like n=1 Tax=Trichosurus vulpecula TaxID=9337 RepID=UPI00186B2FCC|nr:calmodulin-binding transcription activator 1-like [Trichosurus vulpecula]
MWRAEGKWLPKTSRKSMGRLNPSQIQIDLFPRKTLIRPPDEISAATECSSVFSPDDHGNSNGSHVKIFLPKKLLECLPKCSSLPKERHRWNTNERS